VIIWDWFSVDRKVKKRRVLKRNPLKHIAVMQRLNPYAVAQKSIAKAVEASRKKLKQELMDAKRGVSSAIVSCISSTIVCYVTDCYLCMICTTKFSLWMNCVHSACCLLLALLLSDAYFVIFCLVWMFPAWLFLFLISYWNSTFFWLSHFFIFNGT